MQKCFTALAFAFFISKNWHPKMGCNHLAQNTTGGNSFAYFISVCLISVQWIELVLLAKMGNPGLYELSRRSLQLGTRRPSIWRYSWIETSVDLNQHGQQTAVMGGEILNIRSAIVFPSLSLVSQWCYDKLWKRSYNTAYHCYPALLSCRNIQKGKSGKPENCYIHDSKNKEVYQLVITIYYEDWKIMTLSWWRMANWY